VDNRIYVVPAKGLTVINPANNQALPTEGAEVEMTPYWQRRINEGDVVQVAEGKAPAKAKTKE